MGERIISNKFNVHEKYNVLNIINSYRFGDDGIPTDNLVLYQRFNGNVADQTGNSTPTSTGITYANGLYSGNSNESAVWNSNGDNVIIPDADIFSFGNGTTDRPFSISFAFKPTNLGVADAGIYSKFIMSKRRNQADREWQVITRNDATNHKIILSLLDQSVGGYILFEGSTILSNNTTYHVVIRYDGNGSAKILINGIEETITVLTNGTYVAMENLNSNLKIGSTNWSPYNLGCQMDLDGLGIWNSELTYDEALAVYNKQSAGNEIL